MTKVKDSQIKEPPVSISDIIEQFIMDAFGGEENLSISRNQLAQHFNCVPSQINYVLATRFTLDRGYVIESRRGGGGCVTIIRLKSEGNEYLEELISADLSEGLTFQKCAQVLDRLTVDGVLSEREQGIMLSALADKALLVPDKIKPAVRAQLFKSMLIELYKCGDN